MSTDDTPTTSRKKDGNFLLALKDFPSEKRFTNNSSSEDWILFEQYCLSHGSEYALTPFKGLKLAKSQTVTDKCSTILLQIDIITILPAGNSELVKDSTLLYYLNNIEEHILGKNLPLRAKMKFDVLKAKDLESATSFLMQTKTYSQ